MKPTKCTPAFFTVYGWLSGLMVGMRLVSWDETGLIPTCRED